MHCNKCSKEGIRVHGKTCTKLWRHSWLCFRVSHVFDCANNGLLRTFIRECVGGKMAYVAPFYSSYGGSCSRTDTINRWQHHQMPCLISFTSAARCAGLLAALTSAATAAGNFERCTLWNSMQFAVALIFPVGLIFLLFSRYNKACLRQNFPRSTKYLFISCKGLSPFIIMVTSLSYASFWFRLGSAK